MMRKIELYNAKKAQKCNIHYFKWHKLGNELNESPEDNTHFTENYIEEYMYDTIVNA